MERLRVGGPVYRDEMDWYTSKSYYSEDHDNSQDSGTASTTVCSSTSSSPASIMLAQGPNIPSQPRGQPPPPHHPPPHPLPHPQNNPRFDQPFPRRQPEPSIQENSYAEIPYGSLPVNNLDVYNQHKPDPRTNDWKNGNLINIALGQEYPRRTSTNGGPHGDSYRGPDVVGPRVHTNSSLVHLRDGPDGLHRVPDPRMATVDLPTPDFTCTHITPEKRKKKKGRHALLHVIVMALAGIAYIGLGALAGYYFGKSNCDHACGEKTPIGLAGISNDLLSTSVQPENITESYGSLDVVDVTTPRPPITAKVISTTTSTRPPTTTEPKPVYCATVGFVCACGPFGGTGGRPFSDVDDYQRLGNITGFTVRHNDYFISGLRMTYGDQPGVEHGFTEGGYTVQVKLLRGEYIKSVDVDFTGGKGYLSRLLVHTNRRVLGPYGAPASNSYSVGGAKLLYIDGRSGPLIDKLAFYFDKCT